MLWRKRVEVGGTRVGGPRGRGGGGEWGTTGGGGGGGEVGDDRRGGERRRGGEAWEGRYHTRQYQTRDIGKKRTFFISLSLPEAQQRRVNECRRLGNEGTRSSSRLQ